MLACTLSWVQQHYTRSLCLVGCPRENEVENILIDYLKSHSTDEIPYKAVRVLDPWNSIYGMINFGGNFPLDPSGFA